ncbi:MAG: 50S ribosomal protein L21e [Candidatus Woesearchaeota archaeon]
MGKRKGSYRRRSRKLMKKEYKTRGKISVSKFFAAFKIGEKVVLKAEPAYQKGVFHLRFYGKAGIIKGKRGDCYELEICDGGKKKLLIVHPLHLKRLK